MLSSDLCEQPAHHGADMDVQTSRQSKNPYAENKLNIKNVNKNKSLKKNNEFYEKEKASHALWKKKSFQNTYLIENWSSGNYKEFYKSNKKT